MKLPGYWSPAPGECWDPNCSANCSEVDGLDVVGVTSRGRPDHGVAAWRMGTEPPPGELRGHWDVVVHCAASTRWSMTPQEAIEANIAPALALGSGRRLRHPPDPRLHRLCGRAHRIDRVR